MSKMAGFLDNIFIHEENAKKIQSKFTQVESMIKESIDLEKTINQLSANQQIINVADYITIYEKISKMISYFAKSKFKEKDEFIKSLKLLMNKGFRIFEDSFYNILKRFNTSENENEKKNSLHKLRSLAECLSDEIYDYVFTNRLISERSDIILSQLNNKKISASKKLSTQSEITEKNSSILSILLNELSKLIKEERNYIFSILDTCPLQIPKSVLGLIIIKPVHMVVEYINSIPSKQISAAQFFNYVDLLNSWEESNKTDFKIYIQPYEKESYHLFVETIESVEKSCKEYLKSFLDSIENFNEKLENENILVLTTKVMSFIIKLVKFDSIYENDNCNILSIRAYEFINNYLSLIENKSSIFDKTYSPLRWIFLINNIYFVYMKLTSSDELLKKYNEYDINSLNSHEKLKEKINIYIDKYSDQCWGKILEEFKNFKFETKEDNITLKSTTKDHIKRVFVNFNDNLAKHSKIQKQLKIIDDSLEKLIYNKNAITIIPAYDDFIFKYLEVTKLKEENNINDKYIIYTNQDVDQEIKLFFSSHIILNKK